MQALRKVFEMNSEAPWYVASSSQINTESLSFAQELRERSLKELTLNGLPTTANEDWKYTNISKISKGSFTLSDLNKTSLDISGISNKLLEISENRIIFINGNFSPELSNLSKVTGLNIEIVGANNKKSSALENKFATLSSKNLTGFNALNTACSREVVFISVVSGVTIEAPLVIFNYANQDNILTSPRILVALEKSSSMKILEAYTGDEKAEYLSNSILEVFQDNNSNLEHYHVNFEGTSSSHISGIYAKLERDSHFTTHSLNFGGALVRNEVYVSLAGENSYATLNGVSAASGSQHIDNFTVLDHCVPHCESNECYKGIYTDSSRGVFSGTIIVEQDAQKTNAIQSNQALLLSSDASIESRPQLKIWADDVKCTHGATVGQLDESAMFYLRSRGIPKEQAEAILVKAFASDVINQITIEPLKDLVIEKMLEKF